LFGPEMTDTTFNLQDKNISAVSVFEWCHLPEWDGIYTDVV